MELKHSFSMAITEQLERLSRYFPVSASRVFSRRRHRQCAHHLQLLIDQRNVFVLERRGIGEPKSASEHSLGLRQPPLGQQEPPVVVQHTRDLSIHLSPLRCLTTSCLVISGRPARSRRDRALAVELVKLGHCLLEVSFRRLLLSPDDCHATPRQCQ
jgi:hypothetical protein